MRYFGLARTFGAHSEFVRLGKRNHEQIVFWPAHWRAFVVSDDYDAVNAHTAIRSVFEENLETQIVAESSLDSATITRYLQEILNPC